ncbi:MAG TPA: hypothetical protein VKV41_25310 [Methylomirabilota bacterium]|nr:hypothetical protein [Methylomirabilota bacterium]
MSVPLNDLRALLARSYRVGWADGGLLLDFFHAYGESVLLVSDATHTDASWVCAWRSALGTLVRRDPNPWVAVRAVALAATTLPTPWTDPITPSGPALPTRPVLTLSSP